MKRQEATYEWVAIYIIIGFIFGKPAFGHALADMVEGFYMAAVLAFVAAIPVSIIQGVFQQKKSR